MINVTPLLSLYFSSNEGTVMSLIPLGTVCINSVYLPPKAVYFGGF